MSPGRTACTAPTSATKRPTANSELLELVTVSPKGVSPIEAYMVKQRRGDQGSATATSNATKEAVKCADLMLLPVKP